MDWNNIHIVTTYDRYPDSINLAEYISTSSKPVRVKEAPRFINRGRVGGRTLPQTMDIPGQPRSQVFDPFPDEDDDTFIHQFRIYIRVLILRHLPLLHMKNQTKELDLCPTTPDAIHIIRIYLITATKNWRLIGGPMAR